MIVEACDPDSADASILVGELSATLADITGSSGQASFASDSAQLFVVARDAEGSLLGCGALRPLHEGVGEIKRMYARPGTRGVGAALLAHLESAAFGFGYRALWLETRRVNTRAVAFYLKHGYAAMPNYGKYIGRAEAACFGKSLS
ncbi:MAG: GNAT family N-acetyltransferase [Pseudomonadota bacterium]